MSTCIRCGLDYEEAKFAIIVRDFHGACLNCGNPLHQKRIAARWMQDIADLAGVKHFFICFPFSCVTCGGVNTHFHVDCFEDNLNVTHEFQTIDKNGS